jgi:tetratricopeptide (TPR) repeat protein
MAGISKPSAPPTSARNAESKKSNADKPSGKTETDAGSNANSAGKSSAITKPGPGGAEGSARHPGDSSDNQTAPDANDSLPQNGTDPAGKQAGGARKTPPSTTTKPAPPASYSATSGQTGNAKTSAGSAQQIQSNGLKTAPAIGSTTKSEFDNAKPANSQPDAPSAGSAQTQSGNALPQSGTSLQQAGSATPQSGYPPTASPGQLTPFSGQPYMPAFQQQGYPPQYPYGSPYRPPQAYPGQQSYPGQTYQGQPPYQAPPGQPFPNNQYPPQPYAGLPVPYQTQPYPAYSGVPGNPPPQPLAQPPIPEGAAEPFSTLMRPYQRPNYPAQQTQYPTQQAYPQQWQPARPAYPPQYPAQQQFYPPAQQYYQQSQPTQLPQNPQQTQIRPAQSLPANQQSVQTQPTQPQAQTQQTPPSPATTAPEKSTTAANGDNMTEFLANVNTGRQLISNGNPAFAVESLDKAVKLRPRNLSVYFYRGLAFDEAGDPSKAVKNYLESIDRAKTVGMDSAELRTNLGNSYMKLNFFDDAIVEYKKAIEIEPASGAAYMQLGRAYLAKGDYQTALKNLRRCDTLGFNEPTLSYLKALALAALKQEDEAVAELAPLLTEDAASRIPQLNRLAQDLKKDLK